MNDKRKYDRVNWGSKVRVFEHPSSRILVKDGRLKNIGKVGFALLTEEPIKRGLVYKFVIDLNGRPLEIVGRAVHTHTDGFYFFTGVKTLQIPFLHRGRLNRFITVKSPDTQYRHIGLALAGGLVIGFLAKLLFGVSVPAGLAWAFAVTLILFFFQPF